MIVRDGSKELDKIASIINMEGYSSWLFRNQYIDNPEILRRDNLIYYIFENKGEIAGFAAFNKKNDEISIGSVAILDKFRGKIGKYFSLIAIDKYLDENKCKVIITGIDKNNKKSLVFAKWLGFEKYFVTKDTIFMRLINYG